MGTVGSFGNIKFYVKTKKGLPKAYSISGYTWESSAAYEEHQMPGRKPQLEFIGPELWTVSLDIVASAAFGINPYKAHTNLRQMERDGKAEYLELGGKRLTKNKWVISSMSVTGETFDAKGRAMTLKMQVNFTEYVEAKKKATAATNVSESGNESMESTQETAEDTGGTTYTTASGDTLWGIAVKFYGSGSKYTKIYNANKDKISNANNIPVGLTLNIPG